MNHPASQYEFSAEENAEIGRLAFKMRRVGACLELYGTILVISFLVRLIPWNAVAVVAPLDFLTGILIIFLGNRTRHGARAFRSIVTTEGRDVGYLMDALRDMMRIYNQIDRVILVILFVAILLGIGIFVSVAL